MASVEDPLRRRSPKRTTRAPSCARIAVLLATLSACNAINGIGDFDVASEPHELGGDDASSSPNGDGDPDGNTASPDDDTGVDGGTGPKGEDTGIVRDPNVPDTSTEDKDTGVVDPKEDAGVISPGPKRVFVTSKSVQGAFGGLAAADNLCKTAAANGGLGGSWVAWLSTSTVSAIDRLATTGPYKLLDGKTVAATKAQLASGSINIPINMTEYGAGITDGEIFAWTGTTPSGTKSSYTCTDWSTTNFSVYGVVGNTTVATSKWTEQGSPGFPFPAYGCQTSGHFYCFEQ